MGKRFRGVINIDDRDSVPDWEPYLQPTAPPGGDPRRTHAVGGGAATRGPVTLGASFVREGDAMPTTGTLALYIGEEKVGAVRRPGAGGPRDDEARVTGAREDP